MAAGDYKISPPANRWMFIRTHEQPSSQTPRPLDLAAVAGAHCRRAGASAFRHGGLRFAARGPAGRGRSQTLSKPLRRRARSHHHVESAATGTRRSRRAPDHGTFAAADEPGGIGSVGGAVDGAAGANGRADGLFVVQPTPGGFSPAPQSLCAGTTRRHVRRGPRGTGHGAVARANRPLELRSAGVDEPA